MFVLFFVYCIFCRTWHQFLFYLAVAWLWRDSFIYIDKERNLGRAFSGLVPAYICDAGLHRTKYFFVCRGTYHQRIF